MGENLVYLGLALLRVLRGDVVRLRRGVAGFKLSGGLRWTIILLTIVGFPMYALKSRGRRGWSLPGLGVLFFLLMLGVSIGLGWLTDIVRGN